MRILAVAILAAAGAVAPSSGEAHSWFAPSCCTGNDCKPIVSILETTEGDLVTTIDGRSATFPKGFPHRRSQDEDSYACIGPNSTPRCLYFPDVGS
jgi:hypothetical protein